MKKIILSLAVIGLFVGNVIARHNNDEAAKVTIPTISGSPSPSASISGTATPVVTGPYKDGQYAGNAADAFYGNIQVKATISGGKITDVQFLQYPNDQKTSIEINSQAMPYLKQEAIAVQSAEVNIVSGATDSSLAFIQSLRSALSQAK